MNRIRNKVFLGKAQDSASFPKRTVVLTGGRQKQTPLMIGACHKRFVHE
ncbi:hypothetical protein [Bacillus atrophaeus]|nr:hypothetical protein [Bacillus atrophaeus]MCY8991781.1 hypothetical protein [Bacillus atrophaeus]